ncbi:MAG: nuclear transport factor 2 family protein [Bdellovibrionaceae bacterium]|nr:nuclear transport factor 2 family protein [Bdellovibrionales bacterium]MCB9255032.1 nuclear transport factor 2 family protein [Pseudobdellovibrionaceae bacterium]
MTNKEKARAYFSAVNRYDTMAIEAMVDENYIQHNPNVPTGRAAFLALIPKLQAHQTQIENIRILEDGDFVAMHHRWKNAWPLGGESLVAFHVIRFDSAGLIAEHWSAIDNPGSGNEVKALSYTKQHKILSEGNLVLMISEGEQDEKPAAIYDLLCFQGGRVVEHSNITQLIPQTRTINNNTMFGF